MSSTLERSIGLTQATAMVVGTIVGASIFVQPSEVSKAVPTFVGMVWVAAGSLTWFGASICADGRCSPGWKRRPRRAPPG